MNPVGLMRSLMFIIPLLCAAHALQGCTSHVTHSERAGEAFYGGKEDHAGTNHESRGCADSAHGQETITLVTGAIRPGCELIDVTHDSLMFDEDGLSFGLPLDSIANVHRPGPSHAGSGFAIGLLLGGATGAMIAASSEGAADVGPGVVLLAALGPDSRIMQGALIGGMAGGMVGGMLGSIRGTQTPDISGCTNHQKARRLRQFLFDHW